MNTASKWSSEGIESPKTKKKYNRIRGYKNKNHIIATFNVAINCVNQNSGLI